MEKLKSMEPQLQTIKEALSRLSGCDLNHLTLMEARVVQAFRNEGYTDEDYLQLFLLLMDGGNKAAALRELLNQVNG